MNNKIKFIGEITVKIVRKSNRVRKRIEKQKQIQECQIDNKFKINVRRVK